MKIKKNKDVFFQMWDKLLTVLMEAMLNKNKSQRTDSTAGSGLRINYHRCIAAYPGNVENNCLIKNRWAYEQLHPQVFDRALEK